MHRISRKRRLFLQVTDIQTPNWVFILINFKFICSYKKVRHKLGIRKKIKSKVVISTELVVIFVYTWEEYARNQILYYFKQYIL
jgi:hypothetical protein